MLCGGFFFFLPQTENDAVLNVQNCSQDPSGHLSHINQSA